MATLLQDEFLGSGSIIGHAPEVGFGGRVWENWDFGAGPAQLSGGALVFGTAGSGTSKTACYGDQSGVDVTAAQEFVLSFVWNSGNSLSAEDESSPFSMGVRQTVGGTPALEPVLGVAKTGGNFVLQCYDSSGFAAYGIEPVTFANNTDYPGTLARTATGFTLSFLGVVIDLDPMTGGVPANAFLKYLYFSGAQGCSLKSVLLTGEAEDADTPHFYDLFDGAAGALTGHAPDVALPSVPTWGTLGGGISTQLTGDGATKLGTPASSAQQGSLYGSLGTLGPVQSSHNYYAAQWRWNSGSFSAAANFETPFQLAFHNVKTGDLINSFIGKLQIQRVGGSPVLRLVTQGGNVSGSTPEASVSIVDDTDYEGQMLVDATGIYLDFLGVSLDDSWFGSAPDMAANFFSGVETLGTRGGLLKVVRVGGTLGALPDEDEPPPDGDEQFWTGFVNTREVV